MAAETFIDPNNGVTPISYFEPAAVHIASLNSTLFKHPESSLSAEPAIKCVENAVPPWSHGPIYAFNHNYFFPAICTFGIVGNLANLAVLTSRGMRSRTSLFLSAMAIADVLFFVCSLPMTLDVHESIYRSPSFQQFYHYAHMPLLACINWFSAASIWLSIGVTVERLIAVRYPLHVTLILSRPRIYIIIAFIAITTFPLTIHHYFARSVTILPVCGEPDRVAYRWIGVNRTAEPWRHLYVTSSMYVFVIGAIAIPMITLIAMNCALIYTLKVSWKYRQAMFSNLMQSQAMIPPSPKECNGSLHEDISRRSSLTRAQIEERKITVLVALIIASFVILNLPSAILVLWQALLGLRHNMPPWYHEAGQLSNMLVTFGKAMNFIIYCFASSHFRSLVFSCYSTPKRPHYELIWHYDHCKHAKSIEDLLAFRRSTI